MVMPINRRKPKRSHITDFADQLANLLDAGIPLLQALTIIAQSHENVPTQKLILSIKQHVATGATLTQAVSQFSQYFNTFFCQMVAVGEQSGELTTTLKQLNQYRTKLALLRSQLQTTLFYPATLFCMSVVITTVLLLFAVPQFQQLFASVNAPLPLLTRLIINSTHWLQTYWLSIICVMMIFSISLTLYWQYSSKFAHWTAQRCLDLPIIGKLLQYVLLVRIFRTLATLLAAGIPLLNALRASANSIHYHCYRQALQAAAQHIASGVTLQQAFKVNGLFPKRVLQMLAIGEQSGNLESMLINLADYYETQLNTALVRYGKLVEPVTILVVSVIVGSIMLAMYLPMFRIGTLI